MQGDRPQAKSPTAQRILASRLVGRVTEVATLQHALETLAPGGGQCVLLTGEAGIGKSRLVTEIRAQAVQLNIPVFQGGCFESDRTLPLAPLIDLLQTFCARNSADTIARVFGAAAPDLVTLLPDLATVLSAVASVPHLDPEQAQQRLFRTLAHVLTALSAHDSVPTPLVLVLEDLHWCDETTLAFLHMFVRRIVEHPLLLVLTYRSDEVGDELRHFLALLDRTRQISEISLDRFDRQATQAMIGQIFAQQQPVRPEFVDALYALTDGNPFFLEETLKALVASGDIYRVAAGWTRKQINELRIPRTVADAVQRRVQHLSPTAHTLLTLAAVAGQRFDLDLLADVLRIDEPALLVQIKELIAAQLVVEQADDQFAFRHALTRQAIYNQLLARERRPLHRALAMAIEQRYADKLDTRAGDLATHCFEAGEWERAMAYALRAAERARALFAPRVAIEHCTLALEAAGRAEIAAPAQLYRLRGQMADLIGDVAAAHADYEQALAHARASNDQQAAWQSLLDLGVLWNARDHARAEAYLQQALDIARQFEDTAALAQTLYRLGNWHANMDQQGEALRYQQAALALFEHLGDRHGLAMTLDVLGMTSLLVGDMRAAAMYQARAITLLRELDDRNALISCLMVYAQRGLSYLGDVSVGATDGLAAYRRDSDDSTRPAAAAYRIRWDSRLCMQAVNARDTTMPYFVQTALIFLAIVACGWGVACLIIRRR
jgi:tetratricopeptide (TPR) repeat protein